MAKNVLGGELMPCSIEPLTGWFRDASCNTSPDDMGSHTVCCEMTAEFLEFSKAVGNDLSTSMPEYRFPGLSPGDRWCLGAHRWRQAYLAGMAPRVILVSTHERALEVCDLAALQENALL